MKKYQTLKQEIYDLDALPLEQQSVYEAVWNFYQQAPDQGKCEYGQGSLTPLAAVW